MTLRALRRTPAFTAVAVLTLALGIGATTAIFSVVNGILLQPLPYPDADRIVALHTRFPETGRQTPRLTGGDLVDLRAQQDLFEAFSPHFGGEMGLQVGDRSEFAGVFFVNAAFFRVFRVQPVAGRLFDDSEVDRSAVVSLPFAERHFAGGPRVLGRALRFENRSHEIVGVLPAGFSFRLRAGLPPARLARRPHRPGRHPPLTLTTTKPALSSDCKRDSVAGVPGAADRDGD